MSATLSHVRAFMSFLTRRSANLWSNYRSRSFWVQVGIAALLAVLLIGGITMLHRLDGTKSTVDELRTVRLANVASLAGNENGASVVGTVRSVSEANINAESGGTVRVIRATQGASVPAGYAIAELENSAQRAAVLQAEGFYDAAIASRNAVSPNDSAASARNAYRSAFSALDTSYNVQINSFFGEQTAYGPQLLISGGTSYAFGSFSRTYASLKNSMDAWRAHQATAATTNPETLLTEASSVLDATNSFLTQLAEVAREPNSGATAAQIANLAAARAVVSAQQASIAGAREAFRGKSVSSTESIDASIKQALGSLRGAQAQLEKTVIRAPISGTINFLPIHVGDYVAAFTHVATVAQNGALEVVTYVSEEERDQLTVGQKVRVDGTYDGLITRVAPALDPSTRQIEVHVGITGNTTALINGQSVRITLPGHVAVATVAGPTMLPLASVKLRADDRVVFTVNEEGRTVAHAVTIGEVHGDRIEVLSGISSDMRIVTDARGIAEGEKVSVAPETGI